MLEPARLKVTYDELVNKGYSDPLKDPEGDGYCDRSYVIVKKLFM